MLIRKATLNKTIHETIIQTCKACGRNLSLKQQAAVLMFVMANIRERRLKK